MEAMKTFNVRNIEALTEAEIKEMASEHLTIKGHDIYFVTFDNAFGFSALVFLNGGYLHYCNDYALHHTGKTPEELREIYIKKMNQKLYTEKELTADIKSYDDYESKAYYLHNYYAMQKPYVSAFHIYHNKEEEKEFEQTIQSLFYNPVGFCYMSDGAFIRHHVELLDALNKKKEEMEKSPEYMKSAFLYEMYNHEYAINWQGDWDVLSCFGNVTYRGDDLTQSEELKAYFDELNFSDEIRRAYMEARRECLKNSDY